MAKIKFTKTELKKQQDEQKQFLRFLPTLQLKKQQLQLEVRQTLESLDNNRQEQKKLDKEINQLFPFFDDKNFFSSLPDLVKIEGIHTGSANIAGITIPTFDKVIFRDISWDLITTPWFWDEAIGALKQAISLKAQEEVLSTQYQLLSEELTATSQRVNLFEKVKIPECRENIRRIRIMLGDLETSAVARCKIAKRKSAG